MPIWADLQAAWDCLRLGARDPYGEDAVAIAVEAYQSRWWADDPDGYAAFYDHLSRTAATGAKMLEAVRPRRAAVLAAKAEPKGARMFELADRLGWRPVEVAAALLLIGADVGSWASLKDRIRKAREHQRT